MSEIDQTTPEAVSDFLKGKAAATPKASGVQKTPTPGDDLPVVPAVSQNLELPPDAEEFLQATATPKSVSSEELPAGTPEDAPQEPESPPEKERTTVEASPFADADMPSMQQDVAFTMSTSHLGEVTVEDHEKATYIKAALNDATIMWEIPLLQGRLQAKVRSLCHYEFDIIFRAVRMDEDAAIAVSAQQQYSRLQYYAACLQVMTVQQSGTGYLKFEHTDESQLDEDAQKLRDHYNETYANISPARWNQMLTAVRVFSVKEKLCNEALANEDFWKLADGE